MGGPSSRIGVVLHLAHRVTPLFHARSHDPRPWSRGCTGSLEDRVKACVAAPGAMDRVASSSSSSSAAGGAPRAVVSNGDVAAAAGARADRRGGLPSLPDLIALGRKSPAASTAGGGSVATVHGTSPFDPDHVHLAATDRAVASDLRPTGTASQRGPGGPANTPRDPRRRSCAFAPPRRLDLAGHDPATSSAARRRADAETTEVDTTEAEETVSAWAAARAERRLGASPRTDGSAAQMGTRTGRHGRTARGSRRSTGHRPETAADKTESRLLMAEMQQELGELCRLRDQIVETASSAAMPDALPAPARAAPRAEPSAAARSAAPTHVWATSPAGGVHAGAHFSDSEADSEDTGNRRRPWRSSAWRSWARRSGACYATSGWSGSRTPGSSPCWKRSRIVCLTARLGSRAPSRRSSCTTGGPQGDDARGGPALGRQGSRECDQIPAEAQELVRRPRRGQGGRGVQSISDYVRGSLQK